MKKALVILGVMIGGFILALIALALFEGIFGTSIAMGIAMGVVAYASYSVYRIAIGSKERAS